MTKKEILANAPSGATHFIVQPINIVYLRFSGFIEGQLYCNHKKGWRLATHVSYSSMRSLSDIKRIVELEAEILGLKNQIQNQQMCIYEHNSALVGAPVNKIKEQGE